MKKLTFAVSVAMSACLVALTACSGGGGASVSPTASTTPSEPPKPTALVLPPIPDRTANNETLAGISTTGTGVRDDVYRYIFTTYTSTHKRAAAIQKAKSFRAIYLTPPETTGQALPLAKELSRATNCLISYLKAGYLGSFDDVVDISRKMEAMHADTRARMRVYDNFNGLLDGTGEPSPDSYAGSCDAGGGL